MHQYRIEAQAKVTKNSRGSASQFFVAGELCRRGHAAVVTMGNTPNVDILCSDMEGKKFAPIQVKTFRPNDRRCVVVKKAETNSGLSFFWVLVGLPHADNDKKIEYYIVPCQVMSKQIKRQYKKYLSDDPNRKETSMRTVPIPPYSNKMGLSIAKFRDRWDLIDKALN